MEWYRLKLVGLKDEKILELLKYADSYADIFHLPLIEMGFGLDEIDKINKSKNVDLENELQILSNSNVGLIFIGDEIYPESLKNIPKPPVFLYYRGKIELLKEERKIAVVGTRRMTSYGTIVCEKITKELATTGITTVSGLARGIDGICHRTTLINNGKTIAVVGSGLDVVYPSQNYGLWKDIEKHCLVLSEFSLGTPPLAYNFPIRNRIIVGLSRGILVVESKESGGSLITANLGLECGRDIFAVPGDILSPCSVGTNDLIKRSCAKLTTCADDILVEYGWKNKANKEDLCDLTSQEKIVMEALDCEQTFDEILIKTNIITKHLLALLMDLEIKGYVKSTSGGRYRRQK